MILMTTSFEGPDYHFGRILDYGLEHVPDKPAVICRDDRITYSELDKKANRVANAVSRYCEPGERIGILSINCIEYFELVIGCARAGMPIVNINWRLSPREIVNLLDFNDCKIAFMNTGNEVWEEELKDLIKGRIMLVDLMPRGGKPSMYNCMIAGESNAFSMVPVKPDDILFHIHTSGTTGIPKCVMHSHKGFVSEMRSCKDIIGFSQHEVYQVMNQMFHVASIGPYTELMAGGTIVMFDRFEADPYLRSIEKNQVTRVSVIPTVLKLMLQQMKVKDYCMDSVRTVNYSACPIPPSVLEEAIAMLPHCEFIQSYGMTEMGSIVTVLGEEDHKNRSYLHSVGRCIPGCEMKIVGEDGRTLPDGETGEICVKGPSMLKGYYKRPELFEKYVLDGWLHTGDLGYKNQQGYLFLEGRKNHMIISGGENIYPKEIEDRIMELAEDVEEAAVFGVADELWGEIPFACVVLQKGSRLTPEEIRAYLRDHLAHYKTPKYIEIVESLPKNAVGKVVKAELQKKYAKKER